MGITSGRVPRFDVEQDTPETYKDAQQDVGDAQGSPKTPSGLLQETPTSCAARGSSENVWSERLPPLAAQWVRARRRMQP